MTVLGRVSHLLNNLFKLPHPGPEDIQGPCGCRENEGPCKYSFSDYLKHVTLGGESEVKYIFISILILFLLAAV